MLGVLALAIVGGTGWLWYRLIQDVAVPRNRTPYLAAFVAGGVLGVAAIFQGGFVGILTGGVAALGGLGFSALRLVSGQAPNEPAVKVGEKMLSIVAPDETGAEFDLASLTGRPYLLKFFRGHW